MMGNTFIKCFYACDDIEVRCLDDNKYKIIMPEDSIKAVKEFNNKYVMVITSPNQFIERFKNACSKKKYFNLGGYIQYLSDAEINNGDFDVNPIFIKHTTYSKQKEFRIAIIENFEFEHPLVLEKGITCSVLDKEKIINQSIVLDIGRIDDIACVLCLEDLTEHQLIVDESKNTINIID